MGHTHPWGYNRVNGNVNELNGFPCAMHFHTIHMKLVPSILKHSLWIVLGWGMKNKGHPAVLAPHTGWKWGHMVWIQTWLSCCSLSLCLFLVQFCVVCGKCILHENLNHRFFFQFLIRVCGVNNFCLEGWGLLKWEVNTPLFHTLHACPWFLLCSINKFSFHCGLGRLTVASPAHIGMFGFCLIFGLTNQTLLGKWLCFEYWCIVVAIL